MENAGKSRVLGNLSRNREGAASPEVPENRGQGSSGRNGERESRVGTEADRKDVRQESKDKPVVKRRGKNCSQISEK